MVWGDMRIVIKNYCLYDYFRGAALYFCCCCCCFGGVLLRAKEIKSRFYEHIIPSKKLFSIHASPFNYNLPSNILYIYIVCLRKREK